MSPNKIIQAATPVVAAILLYFVFGWLGLVDWMRLALSASMAVTASSFSEAATLASLSGTRWGRSPALRRFASDLVVSAAVAVPVSILLHARFLFLMYGLGSVFSQQGWADWLGAGGGVRAFFASFVFTMGVASLVRLFINRFAKKNMS